MNVVLEEKMKLMAIMITMTIKKALEIMLLNTMHHIEAEVHHQKQIIESH